MAIEVDIRGVEDFKKLSQDYLFEIKARSKKSKVYKSYQLLGLQLAEILEDERHKSLYIKLAKKFDGSQLLSLAKKISENKAVRNKGAYFMKIFYGDIYDKQKK